VGSAVAHCLHLSHHDPVARNVSFERFLSRARAKPPDIDIDFRHDLRDEMMAYVRRAYGDERVANVSNYVTYRGRSLLRDLGKALGFDAAEVDRLRELLWHSRGDDLAEKLAAQPELRALGVEPGQYADLFALCAQLAGLPRHLGTHSSGLVVSDVPLAGVVPLQWAAKGVTAVALDKDDVEAPGIGLLKMDQLSLRALTAVDIAVGGLREADPGFDYAGRDREDGGNARHDPGGRDGRGVPAGKPGADGAPVATPSRQVRRPGGERRPDPPRPAARQQRRALSVAAQGLAAGDLPVARVGAGPAGDLRPRPVPGPGARGGADRGRVHRGRGPTPGSRR
jgi:hypothetical protein